MPNHRFHQAIGDLVNLTFRDQIWFDPACNGPKAVPLYYGAGSREVPFCWVDILILLQGKVVIIEIEESNLKPLQLFGKFYVSAFSTHFNERDISKMPLLFIQVLLEPERTRKGKQWDSIKALLQRQANDWPGRSVKYEMLWGRSEDFVEDGAKGKELLGLIREFVAR